MNAKFMAAIAGIALCMSPASAASGDAPDLPGWLAGCWTMGEAADWTDECWSSARAGSMFGFSRTGAGEQRRFFEFMRIERSAADGKGAAAKMGFIVNQGGSTWTRFEWQASTEPGVTFENTANDYPQRIRYWREGEQLLAEISLADGSKAHRFTYRRSAP